MGVAIIQALVALFGVGTYVFISHLGDIVQWAVESEREGEGLATLRMGYEMAGGKAGGGAEKIAGAIKETLLNKIAGPPATKTRKVYFLCSSFVLQSISPPCLCPHSGEIFDFSLFAWPIVAGMGPDALHAGEGRAGIFIPLLLYRPWRKIGG